MLKFQSESQYNKWTGIYNLLILNHIYFANDKLSIIKIFDESNRNNNIIIYILLYLYFEED